MTSEVERYWDARPCNVKHSLEAIGSLAWSKEVTERKYFVESHIPGFAQFERWAGKRVLEIGCGIGTDTLQFLRHGAMVYAVDLSRKSLVLAAARVRVHRDSVCAPLLHAGNEVRFFHMNAERELPEGDRSFNLVYSFGVLHHTEHPYRVLRLACQRLKSDGELRIMLYARRSLKDLLGEQPEAQVGCPIARRYTRRQAIALVEAAGFRVASIERRHIFPWRIADYVEHRYVKRWYLRPIPAWAMRWLERTLGDHLLIVAVKA